MKSPERTKVVVRRLPPYVREEELKIEVDKIAAGSYNWFRFCQGKTSTKRVLYSRACLNFLDSKGVTEFKSKFDGFVFVGARGAQYKCVVEFAPYQRIPKRKSKTDQREGTLQDDADYISFVEEMDKAPVLLPSAQRQYEEEQAQKLATGEGDDDIVVTPLMEFIVNKHLKKTTSSRSSGRDRRGERRRDHKSKNPGKVHSNGSKRPPAKVLLKTRPPIKHSETTNAHNTTDKTQNALKSRGRKPPKIRDGHQTWVPKVVRRQGSDASSENSKEKDMTSSAAADASTGGNVEKTPDNTKSEGDGAPNGRFRPRRHRSGRGSHSSKATSSTSSSSSSKIVWVPKNEKAEGD